MRDHQNTMHTHVDLKAGKYFNKHTLINYKTQHNNNSYNYNYLWTAIALLHEHMWVSSVYDISTNCSSSPNLHGEFYLIVAPRYHRITFMCALDNIIQFSSANRNVKLSPHSKQHARAVWILRKTNTRQKTLHVKPKRSSHSCTLITVIICTKEPIMTWSIDEEPTNHDTIRWRTNQS